MTIVLSNLSIVNCNISDDDSSKWNAEIESTTPIWLNLINHPELIQLLSINWLYLMCRHSNISCFWAAAFWRHWNTKWKRVHGPFSVGIQYTCMNWETTTNLTFHHHQSIFLHQPCLVIFIDILVILICLFTFVYKPSSTKTGLTGISMPLHIANFFSHSQCWLRFGLVWIRNLDSCREIDIRK